MPRVGVLTTGQHPRPEYEQYHSVLLSYLGLPGVEIRMAHALDGLTPDEIDAMAAQDGAWCIGCHVEAHRASGDRTGPGRREVFVDREKFIPLVREKVKQLELEGVDATIFCCCEEYPLGAFSSQRPLVLPYSLVLANVASFVDVRAGNTRVGIVVPSEMHIRQAQETWSRHNWSSPPELVVTTFDPSPEQMVQGLQADGAIDIVVMWGYGMGIAPYDTARMLPDLESKLDAPVVTCHLLATMTVRTHLRPSMDDRSLAIGDSVSETTVA